MTLPRPYVLKPGAHDAYRNLVFPVTIPADRFVRAVEFRSDGAPVHHAVIRVDRERVSRANDAVDGQPGFEGMLAYEVQDPGGHFIGWAPGRGPIVSPERMPWRLDRGSDLVAELHLLPGKVPRLLLSLAVPHFDEAVVLAAAADDEHRRGREIGARDRRSTSVMRRC